MLLQIKKLQDEIDRLTVLRDGFTGALHEQIQAEIDNLKQDLLVLTKATHAELVRTA